MSTQSYFGEAGLFSLILSSIFLIFMVIMLVHFIRNEWMNKHNEIGFKFWKLPSHALLAIAALSCYAMYTLQSVISSTYFVLYSQRNNSFYPLWCIVQYTSYNFFAVGKVCLYTFWFVRISQVFKNTPFGISTTKLKVMAILFNFPIIMTTVIFQISIVPSYEIVIYPNSNWSSITSFQGCSDLSDSLKTKTTAIIQGTAVGIYVLSEIIYSIVILRLFVSNTLKLSIDCQTSAITPEINNQHSDSYYFLEISIKTGNLLIFAICTNYILFIKYALNLPDWIFLLDIFSNYLSIYLSFAFTERYYKCLFSPFHSCCFQCCARLCYCCCLPGAINSSSSPSMVTSTSADSSNIVETSTSPKTNIRIETLQKQISV